MSVAAIPPIKLSELHDELNFGELEETATNEPATSVELLPSHQATQPTVGQESTGPTVFPGYRLLEYFIYLYLVVQFVTKITIFIDFSKGNPGRDNFEISFVFFLLILNFWLYWILTRRIKYKIFPPFDVWRTIFSPYFYLFLLDEGVLLILPIYCQNMGLFIEIPLYAGRVLAILNLASFGIMMRFDILAHCPLKNDDIFQSSTKTSQANLGSPLKILESSAFRIVLEVQTTMIIQSFYVRRTTLTKDKKGKSEKSTCSFKFWIENGAKAGDIVVLVPETHELPEAIKIKGYRSFGQNKEQQIITEVYQSTEDEPKENLCSKMNERYV